MANPNTQVTTQPSLAPEIKTFYDRVLLERARPVLVHGQFGQERPLPAGNGKTIEFRRFSSLAPATAPLAEGATPDGNSLEVTAITASIAQYGDYITGSDLLVLTAIDPILTETNQVLGDQAGLTLDVVAREVLNAGTSVQYASGRTSRSAVAAGDNLTVLEIRKAVRTLKNNKARPIAGGDYVAIVNPSSTFDLQSDPDWKTPNQYAGAQRIFDGEIGRLYGVRFVESTETKVFAGAGAGTPAIDVYSTLVLGANAYGSIPLNGQSLESIFKALGSGGTDDPLNQRWTSGWKAAQAYKILNDLFMVRIEHSVSA